jgi:FkbM family methyltransferase
VVLRTLKFAWRRRRLARRDIVVQANVPLFRAGARSGVWTVCPEELGPESVVYSFGVGDNLAWELALIKQFGMTVHAFDPTPASVAWVAKQELPRELRFHPIGIADRDGTLNFTLPRHGSRFNYYPALDGKPIRGNAPVELPVRRLATIMTEKRHQQLDVLKMDVEGAEYGVLADLLHAGIAPKQLLVEFHDHFPSVGLQATIRAVSTLNAAGYRIFHISERGLEFSFLRAA